ncbi:MAG: hypothetical protein WC819_06070 [Parcubacteria group bacterium]
MLILKAIFGCGKTLSAGREALRWSQNSETFYCAAYHATTQGGLAMKKATLKPVETMTVRQLKKFIAIFENLPSKKVQDILESGLLTDIRDGNMHLVDRDAIRKLLGLAPLEAWFYCADVGVEIPASSEPFIAKEKFVVNTRDDAKVKISGLGANFENNFLSKKEKPCASSIVYGCKLLRRLTSKQIREELDRDDKLETTLYEMFFMLEKQGNGESGSLRTNGSANIFFIRDDKGDLCAVRCRWYDDGWGVRAYSVDDPDEWDDGSQVFSRDSL